MMRVKKVKYISDYKLEIFFSNGKQKTKKIVDLEELIKSGGYYFEPLKDIEFFKKVEPKYGTIVWPNDADICPDVLYKMEN